MGLWDPVHREHVLAAAREYDALGQSQFLAKYGFRPARAYQLVIDGRCYDSKATLGAAYGYATGTPLSSGDFTGGISYNGAAWALQRLGFQVAKTANTTAARRDSASAQTTTSAPSARSEPPGGGQADVLLVGCVKTKRPVAAPARDLYTSPLFIKRRRYAESSGRPWYILSALHGLVHPDAELEPYDMYLPEQPATYRREWALSVVRALIADLGDLDGRTVEIHAGSSYVDPLEPVLRAAGAEPVAPLRGLTQREHLAWYRETTSADAEAPQQLDVSLRAEEAAQVLTSSLPAPASEFPWGRDDLHAPGLYAWWADRTAAADLGVPVADDLTLVYAGQAGATRWPSGTRSAATLYSRISGQHLGGRISSSTLRQTFAALLRDRLDLRVADAGVLRPDSEDKLTEWMRSRLAATVWPTWQRDQLRAIEERVITNLDAPLNLAGAASTGLRLRLRAGRRALQLPPQ